MKRTLLVSALMVMSGPLAQAEMVNSETQTASAQLGAAKVAQIEFDEGQSALKPADMEEVKNAVAEAKTQGKIYEVRVVSWADQEYPAKGTTAPKASVKLAEDRADRVKEYIKKDLAVSDVKTYNMAKRPNTLQEFFNTKTAKTKESMEKSGAAPTNDADTGFFGLKGKTAAAIVLVYVK